MDLAFAAFLCIQTMVWLLVFGIFNVHTDVNACDCTWGCTNTVREFELTADHGGEKSILAQGNLNLDQQLVRPLNEMSSFLPLTPFNLFDKKR